MQTINRHRRAEESMLVTWRALLQEAQDRPWLAGLLARRGTQIFNRFIDFYRHWRGLPRRLRRALQVQLRRRLAATLLGAALLLAFNPARDAQAASITVDGNCTLADAITAANTNTATGNCVAGSGADSIDLQTDVTLTGTLPIINTDLTLDGNGNTIDANGVGRVLYIDNATVTINNVTLTGGDADSGAGIFVKLGSSNLTINDSTITGNTADFYGGGIYQGGASATINNSTISDNSAMAGAGGIYNPYQLTINNSTISGNTTPNNGGAIYSGGQLTINNSTFSGNSASGNGGSIINFDNLTLNNSTLTNNSAGLGGGVYAYYGSVTLNRTIISGNTSGSGGANIHNIDAPAAISANNYNIIGHNNSAYSYGFTPGASDIVPSGALNTVLDPTLAANGGATLTHALVSGSDAIDIAPDADCLATPINGLDQRGVARNVDGDSSPSSQECDAGAFEYSAPTAVQTDFFKTANTSSGGPLTALSSLCLAFSSTACWLWARVSARRHLSP